MGNMKALPMLDHVMLWVARIATFIIFLLFCKMMFILLPSDLPPFKESSLLTFSRDLFFIGSITSFFSLFFLHVKALRFYLIIYSVLFLLFSICIALANTHAVYTMIQDENYRGFNAFFTNFIAELTRPLTIPVLGPIATLWVALRFNATSNANDLSPDLVNPIQKSR